jgi:hypothetical protein
MKQKFMTNPQALQIRTVAASKKFTADLAQTKLLPLIPRILDALMNDVPITIGVPLVAPEGARIISIEAIIDLGEEWDIAVKNSGPNTPADYNIWKVGHLYPVSSTGVVKRRYHLLNWPNGGGSFNKALTWGKKYNLLTTEPREVFGIGKSNPKFNYEVGPNPCYLIGTKECTFDGIQQACDVWWDDSKRKASLDWVSLCASTDDWFAFRE